MRPVPKYVLVQVSTTWPTGLPTATATCLCGLTYTETLVLMFFLLRGGGGVGPVV